MHVCICVSVCMLVCMCDIILDVGKGGLSYVVKMSHLLQLISNSSLLLVCIQSRSQDLMCEQRCVGRAWEQGYYFCKYFAFVNFARAYNTLILRDFVYTGTCTFFAAMEEGAKHIVSLPALPLQANLRQKMTHSVQTELSHYKRDNTTQVYLPRYLHVM